MEKKGLADNGGIAGETFLPRTVAENDDGVVAGLAVFGSETGAEEWIDTEHGKEIRGDGLNDDFLGAAISGEIVADVGDVSDVREHRIATLPIEEIRRRDGVVGLGVLRIGFPDHHEAARIMIGKRTKENGVDYREN